MVSSSMTTAVIIVIERRWGRALAEGGRGHRLGLRWSSASKGLLWFFVSSVHAAAARTCYVGGGVDDINVAWRLLVVVVIVVDSDDSKGRGLEVCDYKSGGDASGEFLVPSAFVTGKDPTTDDDGNPHHPQYPRRRRRRPVPLHRRRSVLPIRQCITDDVHPQRRITISAPPAVLGIL